MKRFLDLRQEVPTTDDLITRIRRYRRSWWQRRLPWWASVALMGAGFWAAFFYVVSQLRGR